MSGLPQFFEPVRLAQRGETISGDLALSQFPRLRDLLLDDGGAVSVRLSCFPADGGKIQIRGELAATLRMQCQRCLEPFDLPVRATIDASAAPEQGEDTASGEVADVAMCGDDNQVHLGNFIEDELILAVPLAPMHAPGTCPVREYHANTASERNNPFAALGTLKLKKD